MDLIIFVLNFLNPPHGIPSLDLLHWIMPHSPLSCSWGTNPAIPLSDHTKVLENGSFLSDNWTRLHQHHWIWNLSFICCTIKRILHPSNWLSSKFFIFLISGLFLCYAFIDFHSDDLSNFLVHISLC